jgi:hypothetical protein
MSKPPFFQMYRRSPETERDSSSSACETTSAKGTKIIFGPFSGLMSHSLEDPFTGGIMAYSQPPRKKASICPSVPIPNFKGW